MSSDFWDRKKQELYPDRHAPVSVPGTHSGPWWQQNTGLPVKEPQQPNRGRLELASGYIDGHDVSKAGILKGNAEECPSCPRDPRTGIRGNMYRPAKTAAMRCFNCGFIDGRYLGEGQSVAAVAEGQAQRARQVSSGGGIVNNYHGLPENY